MKIPAGIASARSAAKVLVFSVTTACAFAGATKAGESKGYDAPHSFFHETAVHQRTTKAGSVPVMVGALRLRAGFDEIGPLGASYNVGAPQMPRSNYRHNATRPRGVFNSVPIAFGALPSKSRWQSAYSQIERGSDRCPGKCPAGTEAFHLEIEAARNANLLDKLAVVNRAVNDLVAYVPDRRNYGQLDHWASPEQTLRRRRGDCEDYAILKMAALTFLDVPATSMSLIVLLDRRRQVYHAVLAVSTSEGHFILDNLSRVVRRDTEIGDYQPLFSFSADRSWIHGQAKDTRLAAIPVKLSTHISPGEGPASGEARRDVPVGKGLLARI